MAKAKTAYELLERVCEAIKAHPLNYYQRAWVTRRRAPKGPRRLPHELDTKANTCGTAYCRAGWIVALNDGPRAATTLRIRPRAEKLLGLDYHRTYPLFNGYAVRGTPGTPEYVGAGVAGIRRFMRKHADHLKARKLRGV